MQGCGWQVARLAGSCPLSTLPREVRAQGTIFFSATTDESFNSSKNLRAGELIVLPALGEWWSPLVAGVEGRAVGPVLEGSEAWYVCAGLAKVSL